MKIFPSSIIDNSVENHFVENSSKSKIIYLSVILIVILIFVVSFFIKIEITSQARGQVRSIVENTAINSCKYGQVAKIHLHENMSVNVGDTLVWLDTRLLDEKIAFNMTKIAENKKFISDLDLLLRGEKGGFVTEKYISEFLKYDQELKDSDINSEYLRNEYKTAKTLFFQDAISKSDYDKIKNKYELSCSNLKLLKYKYKVSWTSGLKDITNQNIELLSVNRQLEEEKRQYYIVAPITGTILNFKGIAKDGFVAPSQVIAEISAGTDLIVQAVCKA